MEAIIIFSHGSVLCGAERRLLSLAKQMQDAADAPIVEVAFLNYTDPPLSQAVSASVAAGATHITILPYFLVAGKFVNDDLDAAVVAERIEHPGIGMSVGGVIGFHERLSAALLESAAAASPLAAPRKLDLWDVCRKNPTCPLYGTAACLVQAEVAG